MSAITDAIAAVNWNNTDGEISGAVMQSLLSLLATPPLDSYHYKKAIAADATLGTDPVDAMVAFATSGQSPEATVVTAATDNILCPAGGDFEALALIPWLEGASSATPPGQGLSTTSTPTLAAKVAALRAAALLLAG